MSHRFQLKQERSQCIWHNLARSFNYIKKETIRELVSQLAKTRQANESNKNAVV